MQLEVQLAERNVTFDLTDEAIEWLANKGYDERMGARPLGRVIQEHIKKPLANELLFGKLTKGGTVKVKIGTDDAGKTEIELESIPATARAKPKKEATPKKAPAKKAASKPTARKRAAPKGKSGGSGSDSKSPDGDPAPAKAKSATKPTAKAKAEEDAKPAPKPRRTSPTVPKVPRKK